MGKLLPVALLPVLAAVVNGQVTHVANAASMVSDTSLAPGTIVAIFGTHLASGVAVTDNPAQPPQSLGGAGVTVGGVAASLFYVSSTQINAVLSTQTPVGQQTLTVTSAAGTFSSTVTISLSAPPGIFSAFGTGTHDGAITNAVDFVLGPFSVTTEKGSTYLAIFMTGLSVATAPVVNVGGVPVTVQFYGASPCCDGMEQVNVMLPASIQGAGRVEVVVQSGGQSSNAVEVVLLPNHGEGAFPDDQENHANSRELAGIAYVPGTSLALVLDENDDVVRVVDVSQAKVTQVIALPTGAGPIAAAVNSAGTIAVVAERGLAEVAIIDLTSFAVTAQVPVGLGPRSVAIAGNTAVVVNGDAASVSFVGISGASPIGSPLLVGNGPHTVAVDAAGANAYVTNEDSGTVSVINLSTSMVSNTITLGQDIRPASIQLIPGSTFAVIAVPDEGDDGEALVLDLTSGLFTTIDVNPARSGGASDVAINGTTAYFADQTGGAVSYVSIDATTGQPAGPPAMIQVDLGPRALAVDTVDNLLLVTNEGSGTIVLVDLATNQITGRINGVRSDMNGDDGGDDHSDHNNAQNPPVIVSLSPVTISATATITLTITGTNLQNANGVVIVNPANIHGNGGGSSFMSGRDKAFSVSNIQVNSSGTQLTATVTTANAALGARLVVVQNNSSNSSLLPALANTLTVMP
ncbi:MAG TPA: beta-propeller fold lactonase family protein [Bryobacteraceae bacterium]|nr:beta-propeller fold lactonase family protein [Bryobacteraceae bacterium]